MTLTDFRAIFLPYCLERQEDGTYVVLNRRYMPVGLMTADFVRYADFPVAAPLKITPAKAAKLSYESSKELQRIYLYNDSTNPIRSTANMKRYLEKLAMLAKMELAID